MIFPGFPWLWYYFQFLQMAITLFFFPQNICISVTSVWFHEKEEEALTYLNGATIQAAYDWEPAGRVVYRPHGLKIQNKHDHHAIFILHRDHHPPNTGTRTCERTAQWSLDASLLFICAHAYDIRQLLIYTPFFYCNKFIIRKLSVINLVVYWLWNLIKLKNTYRINNNNNNNNNNKLNRNMKNKIK